MRYLALATDYDGTLAHNGRVDDSTVAALETLRRSGRRLVLVTGREHEELLEIFPAVNLFDRVVAENGAILYRPDLGEITALGPEPDAKFVEALRARGVRPVSVGRVIVATREPHEAVVLEVIRELGLDLRVILNKRSVMVLPSGIDKASGLSAALAELGLSARSTVGIGDAENDLGFLETCGCSAAVANALPMLKERVDLVTAAAQGAGVVEVVAMLLNDERTLPARRS